MPAITIDVPESLAAKIAARQERLPEILALGLEELSPVPNEVYRSILAFLAGDPSPEEVLAFRPTLEMQARLRTLLARERAGDLTDAERNELDEYEKIEHFMVMLKAQALPEQTEV